MLSSPFDRRFVAPDFARMDFVRDVPAVALCDEMSTTGGYRTYFAEVFDKRPPIDDIERNVEWVGALQANLTALMAKPSIPGKAVAVYR